MGSSHHDIDMNIDDRKATHHSVESRFVKTFDDGWDVFLGNIPADNFVFDCHAFTTFIRTYFYDDMAILSASTGLFDEFALAICGSDNGLFIGDLRFTSIRIDFKLAKHPVANDLQMEFAHSLNDRLASFLVGENPKSWVFFGETLKSHRHFLLVKLGLWLNCHRNNRIRKRRRLEQDWMIFVTKCITGRDVLDPNDRGDIA